MLLQGKAALHEDCVSSFLVSIHASSKACIWVIIRIQKTTFIDENNGRSLCLIARDATKSLAGEMVNSPGPAPEPELLPSDLSSDWPTGREGGMVKINI